MLLQLLRKMVAQRPGVVCVPAALSVPCWCVLTAEEPLKMAMSGGHFLGGLLSSVGILEVLVSPTGLLHLCSPFPPIPIPAFGSCAHHSCLSLATTPLCPAVYQPPQ